MALRNCLFLILLVLVQIARADEPRLGQSWLSLVQTLEKQGIQQIGDFSLKTFTKQAQKIQWHSVSPADIGEIAEGRQSAYYLTQGQEVFVSTDLPQDVDPAALELHEALGAVGYNDRAYNLSSSLVTLSKTQTGSTQKKLVQGLGATVFTKQQTLASGSGSSVGGGGDLIALTAKNKFVELMLKNPQWHHPATLAYLMQINFEPFYDPNQQFVAFRYQTNTGKGIVFAPELPDDITGVVRSARSGLQEQITFYIPALLWEHRHDLRAKIMEKAISYAQYLIPVSRKFPGTLVQYSCAGAELYFQKDPEDNIFAAVQQSRIAVLSGCMGGMNGVGALMELRHPGFVDYLGNNLTRENPVRGQ